MKVKYAIVALALASSGFISSCAGMKDSTYVNANQVGVAQQVVPATVIAVEDKIIETESTNKNMGTGIGAAVGLGAGQLLGRDKGRTAMTIGSAAAGALIGRYLVDTMGRTKAQQITVRTDYSGETYSFIQAVTKQHGAIAPGMHGNYYHGGNNSRFVPDGAAYATF